ncbi:MAG: DUF924 family protein [Gammaproteobacteria bacterium]
MENCNAIKEEAQNEEARAVLAYWFGALSEDGWPLADRNRLWFGFSAEDDDEMRARFGGEDGAIRRALSGKLAHWLDGGARDILAYIILLDQMTRAVFRGTAEAFCGDEKALAACFAGMKTKADLRLAAAHGMFFYMPLQHGEGAEIQDESVSRFDLLARNFPSERAENARGYAVVHRDIIRQFGRFPHRNAVLGRQSTAAETAYLQKNKSGFGQG